MKVKAIEKSQNIAKTKVDEMIESLLTFEMVIDNKLEKKSKSVVLKEDVEESDVHAHLTESIVLIAKSFSKVMRRLNRISRNNVTTNVKYNMYHNSKVGVEKRA